MWRTRGLWDWGEGQCFPTLPSPEKSGAFEAPRLGAWLATLHANTETDLCVF
jgi:hypothetical protein